MSKRIYFIFFFFISFFVLIIFRLFHWQVLSSEKLEGMAQNQRSVRLNLPAVRGSILASDLSPLVINQKAYGLYFEPYKMKDKKITLEKIATVLKEDEASLSAKLFNDDLIWIPVAHKIDIDKADEIKKNNLSGVTMREETKRYYPESSMAAQLLGFVGKNTKGEDAGYFGLEGYYDQQLRGRDGYIRQEIDAKGDPILTGEIEKIPAEPGRDLILYLDKTIQFIVEKKLNEGINKYGAKGGSIVVIDPFTGGILASASYPSYNPTNFSDYPVETYKNTVVSNSFEPGSTFKTLVIALGLDEGRIKAETKFNEDGPVQIGEYTIRTWDNKYRGEMTMREVLEHSSNVGMVFVQRQIEKDKYYQKLLDLGIGELTKIDLQDEATSQIRPQSKWSEIDYATSSFGQGIAVTPLQMVRAVAAIANGGNLMEPHIVKKIRLSNGQFIDINPKIVKRVFKPEATRIITEMMVSSVENGEAKFAKPRGYRIAGKTGTAQIPISGHYDTEKTIASFVGFAPLDKPLFVMLVTLKEPSSSPWGSETAAPLFFSVAKELFSYLKIPPNE